MTDKRRTDKRRTDKHRTDKHRTGTNIGCRTNMGQGQTWDRDKCGTKRRTKTNVGPGNIEKINSWKYAKKNS